MEHLNKPPRIVIIDSLRGFALAGVALVHVTEQYLAGPAPEGFMEGLNGIPDNIIQGIIGFFFIGKFYAIFSILFGLSFAIQMESAAKKGGDFSLRFLWRAVLLFIIGYVHQLFYRGDILTIYALLVPLLIPFDKVDNKVILGVAALCFLGIPRFISFAVFGNESIFGLPSGFQNELSEAYYQTIKSGSLTEVFTQNAVYGMKTKMDFQLQFFGRFYYTFGYFLLGLWLGKIGLFKNMQENRPFVRKILKWAALGLLGAFVLTAIGFSTAPQPINFSSWHHIIAYNFTGWANLALAIIITCAFILLYPKPGWHPGLSFFAPFGRMALTNYVGQSIIGTFIFFGWGLGLIGEVRTLYLFFIAIVLIVLQTVFSKYWLQYFKYGPLEWLWRSGTYLKWQPLRKEE